MPAVTSPGPTAITHEPMRLAFELAWQSVCAGSLGIGAVVTRADLSIVTTGRNRLFETDPGDDHLAGTSLAHAELNALAKLRWGGHQNEHLVPTHAAAYWGTWIDGWQSVLPATSALAVDLARTGELVDMATRRVDIAVLAAALWDRLTPCVPEVALLAAAGA